MYMYVFVSGDHMLDWHSCQICYPLAIKLLLVLVLLLWLQKALLQVDFPVHALSEH